jgi:hypothetical protein
MEIPKEIYVVLCDEAPSTFHVDLEAAIKESNESPCPGADVWRFKWTGNKYEYDCLVYYYSSEHKKYVQGEVADKDVGPQTYHHSTIYVEEGFNLGEGFDSSQSHLIQCEITELKNTLKLEQDLRGEYEKALIKCRDQSYLTCGCWDIAREVLEWGKIK